MLLKVGITAVERGDDRLAEQGAVAWTWLAEGSLPVMRRLEGAAAATGVVTERMRRRVKIAAWWGLGPASLRVEQLSTAHRELSAVAGRVAGASPRQCQVRDLAPVFGLASAPPALAGEITGIGDGTVISGVVACLAGRDAILDDAARVLLVDLRLLTGWTITPDSGAASGMTMSAVSYLDGPGGRGGDGGEQAVLF